MAWKRHHIQWLVEIISKGQVLETTWKVDAFQALVEESSKGQGLQRTRKRNSFETLIESVSFAVRQGAGTRPIAADHNHNTNKNPCKLMKTEPVQRSTTLSQESKG